MSDKKTRERLIISEREPENVERTTNARNELYRVLARFRKQSERADDKPTQTMFSWASDIIASLAKAFRRFEKREDDLPSDKDKTA